MKENEAKGKGERVGIQTTRIVAEREDGVKIALYLQIVRNVIHRIPPKIRSGIDGNDSRKGAHKSGALAESEVLRRKVRGSPYKPATLSTDDRRRDTM
jgi:hypothetical protein